MTEIDEETFDSEYEEDVLLALSCGGDHDWETLICMKCGGYQGEQCNHCGMWSDGGDWMAGNADWCMCSATVNTRGRK